MKFVFLTLPIAYLVFGVFLPWVRRFRAGSSEEQSIHYRFVAFSWFVGMIFLAALLFLPNKQRILMLAPIIALAVVIAKSWHGARLHAQRKARGEVDLDRMKRVKAR